MWVFTRDGFYSVVEYDPSKDKARHSPFVKFAKGRGTHLLVRARAREHLEALRVVVKKLKIEEDVTADYMYRCVIPRKKWRQYVDDQIEAIDYDSHFKEVVKAAQPKHLSQDVYHAMMDVWVDMLKIQPYVIPKKKGSGTLVGFTRDWWKDKPVTNTPDLLDDEALDEVDEWIEKGWVPATQRLYMMDVINILEQRGSITLSAEEIGKVSDAAWDLYDTLGTRMGFGEAVTKAEIEAVRDEVLAKNNDHYNSSGKGSKK